MHTVVWVGGALLALVWWSRVVDAALGMRHVPDLAQAAWDRPPGGPDRAPRVSIIVPARNEQESIERCLQCLLVLDYPDYEVIAVDDRSTDATGAIMDRVAAVAPASRLKVVHVRELPPRWLGKTHAMWTAACQATGDWLLFTDADVFFHADALRRALAYLQESGFDHLVLFPTMTMDSPGESMMIGFFQVMFTFGHRPWKVADPKTKDHMGVGAFNLVRRSVYEGIGTYERLRLAVVDDMKLGQTVKEHGYRQQNVFGRDLISLHWAPGALGVVDNLTKNAFAVMNFNLAKVLGATFLLLLLNLGPWLGLLLAPGWGRLGYGLAVAAVALLYLGMSWRSHISPVYFLSHSPAALLFAYIMLRSTLLTLVRGGVVWRGTFYPLEELRQGLV